MDEHQQLSSLGASVLSDAEEISDDMREWRRDFHQFPELALEENVTASKIARVLKSIPGMEVHAGFAVKTCVIGVLGAEKEGPALMLRTVMDADAGDEQTGLPFSSCVPGVFHSAGHDAEMASLLGAAAVLSKYQDKEGLKIYTTIDMDMQKAAEDAMKNLPNSRVDANGVQQPQGALVAIDPHNGYIKAMVGGRGTDQFNRATMAERQPGSAFKPFVFAAALENKFTPSTVIDDSPMKVGDWSPQNYNRTFNGKVTLRYVAEQSLNVPTVKIAQKLGIDKPIYYAQEMGISSFVLDGPQNDRNLSTALGGLTKGVTPLELVSAYGTFANKGVHVDPVAVTKVLDRNGKVLEQAEPKQRSVISEQSAAELTDMLQGVIQKGTGTRANIGRPAAGKTGTTSDYHDAWFVGYTPDLVAGVWIGSDDNSSLGGMSGGLTPAVIWKAFMSKALASTPPKNFDGSSAGGKSDAIGELENDKKSELKSDKKTANGKQDGTKSDGGKNAQQGGQQSQGGNQPSAPSQAPAQQPSAPASNVPEPGGGVSKGRN